jgi:hypothetical protein
MPPEALSLTDRIVPISQNVCIGHALATLICEEMIGQEQRLPEEHGERVANSCRSPRNSSACFLRS